MSDFTIHKVEAGNQRYLDRHKNKMKNGSKSGIDTPVVGLVGRYGINQQ